MPKTQEIKEIIPGWSYSFVQDLYRETFRHGSGQKLLQFWFDRYFKYSQTPEETLTPSLDQAELAYREGARQFILSTFRWLDSDIRQFLDNQVESYLPTDEVSDYE